MAYHQVCGPWTSNLDKFWLTTKDQLWVPLRQGASLLSRLCSHLWRPTQGPPICHEPIGGKTKLDGGRVAKLGAQYNCSKYNDREASLVGLHINFNKTSTNVSVGIAHGLCDMEIADFKKPRVGCFWLPRVEAFTPRYGLITPPPKILTVTMIIWSNEWEYIAQPCYKKLSVGRCTNMSALPLINYFKEHTKLSQLPKQ